MARGFTPASSGRAVDMPVRRIPSASVTRSDTTRCSRKRARVPSSSTEPPPNASTPQSDASSSATTSRSTARNAGSPCEVNISAIVVPTRSSITASTSVNRTPSRLPSTLPTVLFPDPGGPTRTTRGFAASLTGRS